MKRLARIAAQRWPPRRPHKPASQVLGPRTLQRRTAPLDRPRRHREAEGVLTGVMPDDAGASDALQTLIAFRDGTAVVVPFGPDDPPPPWERALITDEIGVRMVPPWDRP